MKPEGDSSQRYLSIRLGDTAMPDAGIANAGAEIVKTGSA